MDKPWKELQKQAEQWLKNGHVRTLLLVGCAGVALILISDIFFAPKAESTPLPTQVSNEQQVQALEQRLANLLKNVAGAGKVQVMVTLEDDGETLYAQDVNSSEETNSEQQRQSYEENHVLLDTNNGEDALVRAQLSPQIRGVAVVCDGGADIAVVKRVTELVSVVLGISSNRVYVTN